MPVRRGIGVGVVVGSRFRLEEELGEGGMGRVYQAVDLRHDRPAAVKIIGRRLASDPEFRARFEREASAAERANHPHVLPVWDYGEEGGYLYLATPLCDTDLGELVYEQRGRLDVQHALRILTQVGWALDWAHDRGVVHRDVKPENILLVHGPGEDHAYLADFGMARAVTDETLTQLGHPAALSPAYAAPEQWLGVAVGPEADQYSLAAALFVCLTGRPPFYPLRGEELRNAHLEAPPPRLPPELGRHLEPLSDVLARALAKKPVERFPSCGAFIASARASTSDQSATEAAPERREPTEPEHPSSTGMSATVGDADDQGIEPILHPTVPDTSASLPGVTEAASAPLRATETEQAALTATETGPAAVAPTEGERVAEPPVPPQPPDLGESTSSEVSKRSGRGRLLAALAAVAALAAAAVLAVVLTSGGGSSKPKQALVTSIPVGNRPSDLAAAGGAVWVANMGDSTLSEITPTGGGDASVRSVGTGASYPTKLAAGYGALWAVTTESELTAIDPRSGQSVGGALRVPGEVFGLGAGLGGLWAVDGNSGEVTRYGVHNNRLRRSRPIDVHRGAQDIALAPDAVWVTNGDDGVLTRIDPTTLRATRIRLAKGIGHLTVADGFTWVADPPAGRVFRVPEAGGRPIAFRVDHAGEGLVAVGAGSVFFINSTTGVESRLDERSGNLLGRQQVSEPGASAAIVSHGSLWVADPARKSVERLVLK